MPRPVSGTFSGAPPAHGNILGSTNHETRPFRSVLAGAVNVVRRPSVPLLSRARVEASGGKCLVLARPADRRQAAQLVFVAFRGVGCVCAWAGAEEKPARPATGKFRRLITAVEIRLSRPFSSNPWERNLIVSVVSVSLTARLPFFGELPLRWEQALSWWCAL